MSYGGLGLGICVFFCFLFIGLLFFLFVAGLVLCFIARVIAVLLQGLLFIAGFIAIFLYLGIGLGGSGLGGIFLSGFPFCLLGIL